MHGRLARVYEESVLFLTLTRKSDFGVWSLLQQQLLFTVENEDTEGSV